MIRSMPAPSSPRATTGTTVALVVADLLQIDPRLQDRGRPRRSWRRTGIPREHLQLAGTHTHSGPVLREPSGRGAQDRDAGSPTPSTQAWESRREAVAAVGIGRVDGIGANRRPERRTRGRPGHGDPIRRRRRHGRSRRTSTTAVIRRRSGPNNTLYSADYPGGRVPRRRGGGRRHGHLLDRAAGRREPRGLLARGQHGRHRRAVADVRVRRALRPARSPTSPRPSMEALQPAASDRVWGDSRVVELRPEAPPGCRRRAGRRGRPRPRRGRSIRDARPLGRRHLPRARGRGLRGPHRGPGGGPRARRPRPGPRSAPSRSGRSSMLGVAGRAVRGARASAIRPALGDDNTCIAALCDGSIGYIPTADAFEIGGYEPNASVLRAGRGRAARRRDRSTSASGTAGTSRVGLTARPRQHGGDPMATPDPRNLPRASHRPPRAARARRRATSILRAGARRRGPDRGGPADLRDRPRRALPDRRRGGLLARRRARRASASFIDDGFYLGHGADRSMRIERTPGYARALLDDGRACGAGDLLIIVNAYGINSATIDSAAVRARARASRRIGVTSIANQRGLPQDHPSRHPSGKDLCDLVDIVVDTKMPLGDAVLLDRRRRARRSGPSRRCVNAYAMNSIMLEAIAELARRGIEPPVWRSSNSPGGDEANVALYARYRNRVPNIDDRLTPDGAALPPPDSTGLASALSDDLLSDNPHAFEEPSRPCRCVDRRRLTTAVASHIKDAIVRGEFAPGSRLPEVALAAELEHVARHRPRGPPNARGRRADRDHPSPRRVRVAALGPRDVGDHEPRGRSSSHTRRVSRSRRAGADPAMQAEVADAFEGLSQAVATGDPATVADADVGFHRAVFRAVRARDAAEPLEPSSPVPPDRPHEPDLVGRRTRRWSPSTSRSPRPSSSGTRSSSRPRSATHVIEAGELLMTRMAPLEAGRSKRSRHRIVRPRSLAVRNHAASAAERTAGRNRDGGRVGKWTELTVDGRGTVPSHVSRVERGSGHGVSGGGRRMSSISWLAEDAGVAAVLGLAIGACSPAATTAPSTAGAPSVAPGGPSAAASSPAPPQAGRAARPPWRWPERLRRPRRSR